MNATRDVCVSLAAAAGLFVCVACAVGQAQPGASPAASPATSPATNPASPPAASPSTAPAASKQEKPVLSGVVKSIDGKDVDLASYAGQVVLVVNVASQCGFTRQYAGLEALYASRKANGLVVLGFPANDFGSQEPGSDAEIASFCSTKFGVTFPMFSKISVKGSGAHPLFARLTEAKGEPKWNFTKYLVGRDGAVIERFDSRVAPDDPAMLKAIDAALAAKAPAAAPAKPASPAAGKP
jgi:glutathione peroxidase